MALRKKKSLTPFKKSGSVESAALINSWQDFGAATPPVQFMVRLFTYLWAIE
jgi:hypothetical protein